MSPYPILRQLLDTPITDTPTTTPFTPASITDTSNSTPFTAVIHPISEADPHRSPKKVPTATRTISGHQTTETQQ